MARATKITCVLLASTMTLTGCATTGDGQQSSAAGSVATGAVLGAVVGGVLGSRGGMGSLGGALAGAAIGGAMGAIIHQLTVQEQQQRQAALQTAARRGSASWASRGETPKRGSYQRVGMKEVDGKQCHLVSETIVLPNGERGNSVETVCFA